MTDDTLREEIATVAPFANTDPETGAYTGEVDA